MVNGQMSKVKCSQSGFTLLEIIIYFAVVSLVLLLTSSFIFYFMRADYQTQGNREVLDNARRALEIISFEVNGATGIYTPTTAATQLSLETPRYLPQVETTTYIDFFVCGTRLCLKKESQSPIFLTSDTVQVNSIAFTQISINGAMSIRTNLALQYKNTLGALQPAVTLYSTASLRKY